MSKTRGRSDGDVHNQCITAMNAKLAERHPNVHVELLYLLTVGRSYPTIALEWVDPAKKARGDRLPKLLPKFCPFCGVRYTEREGTGRKLKKAAKSAVGRRKAVKS